MRETLEELAAGELSVSEAEAALSGYVTTSAGRFDASRARRRGIPEAILAEGKSTDEVASLVETAMESTGRAVVTRADTERAAAAEAGATSVDADSTVDYDERARTVVARTPSFDPPELDATVGIVTAGTADAEAAGEAAVIARETGATVERVNDVGVAHIGRILDQVDRIREADVLVVAAGREGALPTVVAGLVETPVIALPISSGYGAGGDGEAALLGALQSCTVLSVVNVDAGFVAGAQAALVARAVDAARRE